MELKIWQMKNERSKMLRNELNIWIFGRQNTCCTNSENTVKCTPSAQNCTHSWTSEPQTFYWQPLCKLSKNSKNISTTLMYTHRDHKYDSQHTQNPNPNTQRGTLKKRQRDSRSHIGDRHRHTHIQSETPTLTHTFRQKHTEKHTQIETERHRERHTFRAKHTETHKDSYI